MVTTTTTPARASSIGSPSNDSLSLFQSEKSPNGSPGNSNPVKETFHLLDLLEQVKHVSAALVEFKEDQDNVNDKGNKHLEVMIESLDLIYSTGQKQVGKISKVKYLKKAYNLSKNADRKRKAEDPMLIIRSGAVYGLKKFLKKCKMADVESMKTANSTPRPMLYYEEKRKSGREIIAPDLLGSGRVSTSPQTTVCIVNDPWADSLHNFTGLPPQSARQWTTESLILFMDDLVMSGRKLAPFLAKILERGRSSYSTKDSLRKMYRNWKKTGVLPVRGRPSIMSVDDVVETTTSVLKSRTNLF